MKDSTAKAIEALKKAKQGTYYPINLIKGIDEALSLLQKEKQEAKPVEVTGDAKQKATADYQYLRVYEIIPALSANNKKLFIQHLESIYNSATPTAPSQQVPNEKLKTVFDKTTNDDGWGYVRNEIIDRISGLKVDCPECESIIHSDEQYQCGTCGGGSQIFVLDWIKKEISGLSPQGAEGNGADAIGFVDWLVWNEYVPHGLASRKGNLFHKMGSAETIPLKKLYALYEQSKTK